MKGSQSRVRCGCAVMGRAAFAPARAHPRRWGGQREGTWGAAAGRPRRTRPHVLAAGSHGLEAGDRFPAGARPASASRGRTHRTPGVSSTHASRSSRNRHPAASCARWWESTPVGRRERRRARGWGSGSRGGPGSARPGGAPSTASTPANRRPPRQSMRSTWVARRGSGPLSASDPSPPDARVPVARTRPCVRSPAYIHSAGQQRRDVADGLDYLTKEKSMLSTTSRGTRSNSAS